MEGTKIKSMANKKLHFFQWQGIEETNIIPNGK
jgi:hypothetical protein